MKHLTIMHCYPWLFWLNLLTACQLTEDPETSANADNSFSTRDAIQFDFLASDNNQRDEP